MKRTFGEKGKKEIKKVENNTSNNKKNEKDDLFKKTIDKKKKVVSFNIPEVLDEILREYSFMEKESKSEFATKALLEYLPDKYKNKI